MQLTFSGRPKQQVHLPKKTYRAIYKGLNNLSTKDNHLHKIQFFNLSGSNNEYVDMVFSPLNKYLNTLHSIEFSNTSLLNLANGGKALGGLITNMKSLLELRLNNSIYSQTIAKEVSDGLMRAKQVQYIDISNNPQITDKGLS